MKYLILFFALILFVSCHNKNDLEKIKELEIQNGNWKAEIERWNILYENASKIIVQKDTKSDSIERKCISNFAYKYLLINQTSQKRIQLNQEKFESQLRFCIDNSQTVSEYFYSIPQKNKNENFGVIQIKNGNRFTYIPKDTGWYYWKGNVITRNMRTGEFLREYPFIDSFYVYK